MAQAPKGLPKFDTTGWLSVGVVACAVVFASNLWAAIARPHDPFFPFRFSEIAGMVIALGLGIHCVDMIPYHRKRRAQQDSSHRQQDAANGSPL